jgi:hypothetical protein
VARCVTIRFGEEVSDDVVAVIDATGKVAVAVGSTG